MTIGDRIKSSRIAKGATQEELAKALNTTKQTIYTIMIIASVIIRNNIISNIPSDKIEAMASFLCVSESYLMGWHEVLSLSQNYYDEIIKCCSQLNETNAEKVFQYAKALLEVQQAENEIKK